MGGLFSNFFGGASSKSKVVQTPNWNPQQQQTFGDLYGQIQKQGMGPAPTSPDAFVPRTAEDQQYLDYANSQAVRNMATGVVPYEVGPEYANQYFEQAIRPIAMREWNETTRPGIEEAYAGSTFNSTGRLDAITKATEKFGEGLTAQKAGLIYNEEMAKRKAIESAQGRISEGQRLSGSAATYARAIETERVMNSVQKYLMGEEVNGNYNAAYNPMVTLAFNLLGLKPFTSNVETKSEGAGFGYSALGSVVGGFTSPLGGSMFNSGTGSTGNNINSSPQGNPYGGQTGGYDPYSGSGGSVGTGVGVFGGGEAAGAGYGAAVGAGASELPWYLL